MIKIRNGFPKAIGESTICVFDDQTPENVALSMIERGRQREPFYVFNMDEVYNRLQYFKKMMPRVKIFYAMKANDSELMLKLALSQGTGFDCASPGEIEKIRQLNVCPLSIIYAMTTKTPEQMIYARRSGVKHTTFDSTFELKKLKQYWPDANLLLRIRVDGDSHYSMGIKFGCDFDTEAVQLLEEAAALNLKVVGIAFHVGSACYSIKAYLLGLQRVKALFDHEKRAGRGMKIVDIGGGFWGDRTDRIEEVSVLINHTLEDLFPDPSIQVIAEPGRYICESSTSLYCSINNVRSITENDKSVNMVYLDHGSFGTLRFTAPWHTVEVLERVDIGEETEEVILWGPCCTSADRVMSERAVLLPRCSPCLDWLVFRSQGAYTHAFACSFSCLGEPLTRSVVSLGLWKKIKDHPLFKTCDFELSDISAPLPSTLPPLLPDDGDDSYVQYGSLTLPTF